MDMRKALHAIATCISGMKGKEGPDPTTMIGEIPKAITERIKSKLNLGIAKIKAAADKIQKLVTDTGKNLDEVAKSSNKINNMVSTYREALLVPAPLQNRILPGVMQQVTADPRIARDAERKTRQILIEVYNKEFMNQSMEALKNKFVEAIGKITQERPKDVEIQEIRKLQNGGVMIQFQTKEAAEWLKLLDIESAVMLSKKQSWTQVNS